MASLLAAAVTLATLVTGAGQTASAATLAPASSTHPYSNPVWYPLRKPARPSCYRGNPGCPGYHSYWALDILAADGKSGAPVYAAGAGIVHIGAVVANGCNHPGPANGGTWVWIDHGAGVVSKYEHFASIKIKDGQYVTPATEIGTMGQSGDYGSKCTEPYLDFQIRYGGLYGPTHHFTSLYACVRGRVQSWPRVLNDTRGRSGYADFNLLPKAILTTPTADNSCLPTAVPATAAHPGSVAASAHPESVTASWAGPPRSAGVTARMIQEQTYHPSTKAWGDLSYRERVGSNSTTYGELENGRTYRFRVAFANSAGWSAWSSWTSAVPCDTPLAPTPVRWFTTTYHYLHFGWTKPEDRGTAITGYGVKLRHLSHGSWSDWTWYRLPAGVYHQTWSGLPSGTTYQAKVETLSAVGDSTWVYSHPAATQS